ncbi:transcriptional regulator [Catellatospora sp. IY07-71]|uniref:helix-turn-helix domain-containing protein n=1 Tax=Catellatospora sp. IY07-71 TaxID=2728827 RepID=UPI001BB31CA9|nr:helix-turn-helix domain-containing protein [Catellatospora sp. IY07-71]BCJ78205.1 transcriptional regulator [Catellatospora sp. IY07-71]
MSRILFGVRDAADIRFCISPLWETVRGRYVLGNSDRFPVHLPWLRWARQVRPDPAAADGLALLSELTRAHGYLPDFLTPAPPGPLGELDDELAVVAATPADVLHADLAATTQKLPLGPRTTALLDDPARLLGELVVGAREWHRVAIAPYWARMRAVLEADVAYRSRQLAEGGVRLLFDSLHPTVGWAGDHIASADPWDIELDLRGRGLPLMPSVFVRSKVLWTLREDSPPFAVYPARAVGSVWEDGPAADGALAALFGASRARLLDMLRQPATTSELARRTGMAAGTVSEHLGVMHAAGLLARSRHGRTVLYVATAAGQSLLDARDRPDPG